MDRPCFSSTYTKNLNDRYCIMDVYSSNNIEHKQKTTAWKKYIHLK